MVLTIGFRSFNAVATFLEDYRSGELDKHFRPIQEAARRVPGYESFTLKLEINIDAIVDFVRDLGNFISLPNNYIL